MGRAVWVSSLVLTGFCGVTSMGCFAANATLQQQQVNLRQYQVDYDGAAQKYTAAGVNSSPTPSAQAASQSSEFRVRFGGSCQPNTHLDKSAVRYYGDNSTHWHNWSGNNNLNDTTKNIATHVTQNWKLAEACNKELKRKIDNGATYNQLKSASFQIWQAPWGDMQHTLTCSDGSSATKRTVLKSDVQCGPADVKALKRKERRKAKVLEATATLTGAEMGMKSSNCPVQANLRFYVKTDLPTVVKYTVVTPTGQRSSQRTLPVSLDQGNYYEASTNIPFSIPQSSNAGSNSLPPGTIAPATNSLAINQGSSGGHPTGHAGSSALQQLQPGNLHSNAFRIEITKPKRFQSNSVGYSVECVGSTTHAGPGVLSTQQRNTHPNTPPTQLQNRQGKVPRIRPLSSTDSTDKIEKR